MTWTSRLRKVRIGATNKGDDDRFAHMPNELIAALANIPGERNGQMFVFKSRGNIKTQWAGAIRRAGIRSLSPHAAGTDSRQGCSIRV